VKTWLAGSGVVLLGVAALQTHAQEAPLFRLGRWGGLLELDYVHEHQQTHSPGGVADVDSVRRQDIEQFTLSNDGFYAFDPRLFTGRLSLTWGVVHDRNEANGVATYDNSRLTGYAFDGLILPDKPMRGRLFANRNESYLTQPFSSTDSVFENYGAEARLDESSPLTNWDIRHLSSSLLGVRQRLQETTTGVLGDVFRRDERQDILTWTGHNGFQSSDLDLRYEYDDFQDLVIPQGTFRTNTAVLNYSADFGPDRNRLNTTVLSYTDRTGISPTRQFIADERIHIDHYTNLASDYRYQLQQIEVLSGTTTTQTGSVQVEHHLYNNLTSTALASVVHIDLPTGTRDIDAGQVNFSYRRGLPGGGTVSLSLNWREQVDENRLLASQISVTDEPHTAPSPIGAGAGFELNQPFVVTDSIVVVNARGGARLPCALGVDYEIRTRGDRTLIVPLVTSVVIRAGDPMLVSYAYAVDPSIKYRTSTGGLLAGLDFGWIALTASHDQSDQKLIEGQDTGFLEDFRKDTVQVNLRGNWSAVLGEASAAYEHYDGTRLAYAQRRFRGTLTYRPTRDLTLGLDADRTLTDFSLPEDQTDQQSLRLTLNWFPAAGWTVTGLGSRRIYKDSLQPTEAIDEASLRARFDYAKLTLQAGLNYAEHNRGGYQSSDWRLDMTAVRRF